MWMFLLSWALAAPPKTVVDAPIVSPRAATPDVFRHRAADAPRAPRSTRPPALETRALVAQDRLEGASRAAPSLRTQLDPGFAVSMVPFSRMPDRLAAQNRARLD